MSKTDLILKHLQEHKTITSWEAITKYRATRLAAIIHTLRQRGYCIETEHIYKDNADGEPVNYARYILVDPSEIMDTNCTQVQIAV